MFVEDLTFIDSDEERKNRRKKKDNDEIRARQTGEIIQCMKRFFLGKPYYKSYPDPKDATKILTDIPQDVLISSTNVDIILSTEDLNEAMALVEEVFANLAEKNIPLVRSGRMTKDKETKFLLGLITEFRALEIPTQYQGGMMLLYLWLCEGVEFK